MSGVVMVEADAELVTLIQQQYETVGKPMPVDGGFFWLRVKLPYLPDGEWGQYDAVLHGDGKVSFKKWVDV